MRELVGELERKKKLRKKEERREAGERERERIGNLYFNERREKLIKKLLLFFTCELQCTSKD